MICSGPGHSRGWTAQICRCRYAGLENNGFLSIKNLFLTVLIIALSFAIEKAVHSGKDNTKENSTEQEQHRSQDGEHTSSNVKEDTKATARKWLEFKPSPELRARRLVIATCLIVPSAVAFAYRIRESRGDNIARECFKLVQVAPPNWWLVVIFNILPFMCSCTAWLRAFVDCVLVRFDGTLNPVYWPPAFPLTLVAFLVAWIVLMLHSAALALMGRSDLITKTHGEAGDAQESTELSSQVNEEERGLIDGIDKSNESQDGFEDDDDDDFTVYSPRGSIEEGKTV